MSHISVIPAQDSLSNWLTPIPPKRPTHSPRKHPAKALLKCHRRLSTTLLVAFTLVLLAGCASSSEIIRPEPITEEAIGQRTNELVTATLNSCKEHSCGFQLDPGSALDTVRVNLASTTLSIGFNEAFAQVAWREQAVAALERRIQSGLDPEYSSWTVRLTALGVPLKTLVPNLYRSDSGDETKRTKAATPGRRLTTRVAQPWKTGAQLSGRHVAIWPSHGWYYENRLDRWEWQRARLFQTVEDLFPMSIVVPYLAPMLERSGAHVHMPRERDVQRASVVVDNDQTEGLNRYLEVGESDYSWRSGGSGGFLNQKTYTQENPFSLGTYRISRTDSTQSARVSWIPAITERGRYAVYVSYGIEENATSDARYTIYHAGGSSEISVNQQMKGGTWVYLGTFLFDAGMNPDKARVELSNISQDLAKTISADAVRFGGGMGVIQRNGQTSKRPKYTEAARYYMQFAGMPDSLVYNVTQSNDDYIDDYRGRAEWVNYLAGAPNGPNKNRQERGLNVPVDVSLAFHTDAGITKSDSTIGTLLIYSSEGAQKEKQFPSGMSRFANRDLADIVQTNIVRDLRSKYDSSWTRRAIWDRDYSEAVRPNVPGILLELLSHQNFADMKYGLDPRFRFDVARSVYKGILQFIADQNGFEPIVQPLPVKHMGALLGTEGSITVSWDATPDPLEPSAEPSGFVVYTRQDDAGYDEGTFVKDSSYNIENITPGVVYAFRVSAVNEGGESMLSEEVAAGSTGLEKDNGSVLIVAAFDRVSAPGHLEYGTHRGFSGIVDEGVADGYDLSFVGEQYDFDIDSPWLDDDSPGHGASFSTFETQILTGNTFDYPALHGASILAAGYSFSTLSDESYAEYGTSALFQTVDLVLGEEKMVMGPGDRIDFSAIPAVMQDRLRQFSDSGGSIFISGAHVATDLAGPASSEEEKAFASEVLGFSWRTDHAVQSGDVVPVNPVLQLTEPIGFNTDPTGWTYRVESPDALEPVGKGQTLMRYADNNMSAVVGREGKGGVVVMGFPFETIGGAEARNRVMKAVLQFVN